MWDVRNTATTDELRVVAHKVMNAGIYLYMMRLLLCIFQIVAFGYSYANPGYWTGWEWALITNFTMIPGAIFWYGLQWRSYPVNRQGSSMTLRRTPYDPEYAFDQGIRELNNMNALFEPLGVLLWTATFVCMILWPNGKDFRLAFVKPPVALYRSGTVVTGVQILLSVAQCWLVIRERQFVKIHIARCHDPVVVDHGLGADNFEHVEMRPLPQRAVHPRPSIGTMSTVHGSDVHPASFV